MNVQLDLEWLPVAGYENYEVSNFGEVRNTNTGCILRPRLDNGGYMRVMLYSQLTVKTFFVHRLVALAFIENKDNKPCVDHIDGNKLNNNVTNLRWCTKAENNQNKEKSKQNTSGFKGVTFRKDRNKWRARIKNGEREIHLGYFNSAEEAAAAYDAACIVMHGVFAHPNAIPPPKIQITIILKNPK